MNLISRIINALKFSIYGIHHGPFRRIKEQTLDRVDFFYRLFSGQLHLPPFTLRQFVGGAKGYGQAGIWLVEEFKRLNLLGDGSRVFDVGCGCGRLAFALAMDPEMTARHVEYAGMDVDNRSIAWCQKNITTRRKGFSFYQADIHNKTYNPAGRFQARNYRFPHDDGFFNLIVLTSVFTHLLETECRHYLMECGRVLKSGGTVYASFFTFKNKAEAAQPTPRRPQVFTFFFGHYALESEKFPEAAVAYEEDRLRQWIREAGLTVKTEPMYGLQDVFLLSKV